MRRCLRFILVTVALAMVVFPAGTALAGPATWQAVDVTMHAEPTGGVTLISGELAKGASLPAQAELSVPAGSKIQWIGEILGGDPAADPALTYTKTTAKGADIYRFTLTKSREAQIEIETAGAEAPGAARYTPSLVWPATQNVPVVRLSVRMPQGAQVAKTAPGASVLPGEAGYSYYSKTVKNVKAGDTIGLDFAYTAAVGAAATPAASSPKASSLPVTLAVLLLICVAIAGLVVAVRRKMAATGSVQDADRGKGETIAGPDSKPSDNAESVSGKRGLSTAAKRGLIAAAIIGVIVVAAVIVGRETTRPQVTGDTVTQVFAQGQPCATATIALAVPAGTDTASTAEKVFAALKPVTGMNTATYNAKTSSLDVGFCESVTSEATLREAVAKTGLLAQAKAAK